MHKKREKQTSAWSLVGKRLLDFAGLWHLQGRWNDIFGEAKIFTQVDNSVIGQVVIVMAPCKLLFGVTSGGQTLKQFELKFVELIYFYGMFKKSCTNSN